ncbi:MAG: PASTA domain-containing protein [Actinobacteria bacterium]|nr:PASTA domain-containing protein [Actinomycetota bacterium]
MKVLRDIVGETLSGRYRIISRIADGGMGEVFRGHDLLLDRAIAVKVLQQSLAHDPELVQRFKAEARAAARLSHPNVVQVHDWGSEHDSIYYMVMEYVAGTDLRDVLVGRGPLPPARAAAVTASVCDALEAAHARGLIHRDVKPENVLIARDGKVKVADFGIAAIADVERSQPGGAILGTLRYLSPEQAAGSEATMASDIWAAGALFFELLIGSPPQGGSGAELLRRRAIEPPKAPSSLEPRLPRQLDDIVLRACAVDPVDRYRSAGEMSRALRDLDLEDEPDVPVEEFLAEVTGEVDLPDMEVTRFAPRSTLKKHGGRPRGVLRTAFLAMVILLLVAGGVKAAGAIFGPHDVEVPSLSGLSYDAAKAKAEAVGLTIEVVKQQRDPHVPEGDIISQTPSDGMLLEGKAIGVVVSRGLPLAAVPQLIDLPLTKAEKLLQRHHLEPGEISHEWNAAEVGTVVGQSLPDHKLEWGSEVDLVVSKGPQSVEVPSVDGLAQVKAERILEDAGFVPIVVRQYSDDIDAGDVVTTTPLGTSIAPKGSEVQVIVSRGPQFKEIVLPDVRQMDVDSATALLESKGLRVSVRRTGACAGGTTVVETSPVAGSTVHENDLIALFAC